MKKYHFAEHRGFKGAGSPLLEPLNLRGCALVPFLRLLPELLSAPAFLIFGALPVDRQLEGEC